MMVCIAIHVLMESRKKESEVNARALARLVAEAEPAGAPKLENFLNSPLFLYIGPPKILILFWSFKSQILPSP